MKKPLSLHLFLFVILTTIITVSKAGNIYWISSTPGSWFDASNWSSVSGGNGGAGIPTTSDVAIFDQNGTGACTIDVDADVQGIRMEQGFNSTLALYNGPNLFIGTSGFAQRSGTFDGENGYMELHGNFLLSGGTFLCPQSSMDITGPRISNDTLMKWTGGQFVHQNSDLYFSPESNCNAFSFCIDVPQGNSFYNIIFNTANTCQNNVTSTVNIVSGDTLHVTHDLHINSGKLGGLLSVSGNLSLLNGSTGGCAKVILNGPGTQTYSAPAGIRMDELVIDKPSGSVVPTSGTVNFSISSFTLANGTFLAPSGTLYIGGPRNAGGSLFTQTGGIFDHDYGVVVFDPQSVSSSCTFQVNTGNMTPFYKVVINAPSQPFTSSFDLVSCDSLFCENTLELLSGSFNNGKFVTESDVTIGTAWNGGTTSLTLSGKNPQTITATGASSAFDGDITIRKEQDAVTLLSPLVIDHAGQVIHFVHGHLFSTSANLLSFAQGTFAMDANDSSFVCGPVAKAGYDAFEFPLGKPGYSYAPLRIDATGDPSNAFSAEYFPSSAPSSCPTWSMTPSLNAVSTNEYWNFTRLAGNTGVNVWLSWGMDRSGNISSTQSVVAQWNGSAWTSKGNQSSTGNFIQSASPVTTSQPLTFGTGTPLGVITETGSVNGFYFNVTEHTLVLHTLTPGTRYAIMDVNGKMIAQGMTQDETTHVDMSTCAAGTYFIDMQNEGGRSTGSFVTY